METIIKNHGLTNSVIDKWSGNLELTVNDTPVIVGVEYEDGKHLMRIDFIRFVDSAFDEDGYDLVWEREDGWQGIPDKKQVSVSVALLTMTASDLDELTTAGGRPLFWD